MADGQGWEGRVAGNRAAAAAVVGLSRPDAVARLQAAGLQVRVVDWDDLGPGGAMLTMDLRPDRVTVHVRDGVVEKADVG